MLHFLSFLSIETMQYFHVESAYKKCQWVLITVDCNFEKSSLSCCEKSTKQKMPKKLI